MSCSDYPYNINDFNTFNEYIDTVDYSNNNIDFSLWQSCVSRQKDISHVDLNLASINTILNTYNIAEQNRTDTANELNKYSMTLFQNDIYYTYGKILFFIILIGAYLYFFRINGIIQPIMNLFNGIKTSMTDTLPKILNKKTNALKTNALKPKISKT